MTPGERREDGPLLRDALYSDAPAARGERGLREALERLLAQPTLDIQTSNAKALFEKANQSATQEVTLTAQLLRMLLPAIESEAVTRAIRAILEAHATARQEPAIDVERERERSEARWAAVVREAAEAWLNCDIPAHRASGMHDRELRHAIQFGRSE
ncbi:MAG: hypothetical protein Q8Q29_00630 [Actinomycetota bacterium]|nr:hypothetical protein [Actinomycetota bacterium]